MSEIKTNSEAEFNEVSANLLLDTIKDVLSKKEYCTVGLSGGSTPKPIFQLLTSKHSILAGDWKRVIFFLIDERYISDSDNRSNQKMIKETIKEPLITNAAEQFVFPNTELDLAKCIEDYNKRLTDLLQSKGNELKSADIVTLGMGNDGHIASLFPTLSNDDLPENTPTYQILHRQTDVFDVKDRITVNLKLIQNATHKILYLKGNDKKQVWDQMKSDQSDQRFNRWPALSALSNSQAVFYYSN